MAKLSTTLLAGSLLGSTYLGGTGDDHAYALAIDSTDDVFVAGETASPGIATAGAFKTVKSAGTDAFVAKLDANLQGLTLTYLGGSGDDRAQSLAIKGANIYVFGDTTSTDFPVTTGAYQTTNNGGRDAFIAKLNNKLTDLSVATYFGGSRDDYGNAVTLDAFGNVYTVGFSFSSNLPTTPKAYQRVNAGFSDAFVAEFDANLSTTTKSP